MKRRNSSSDSNKLDDEDEPTAGAPCVLIVADEKDSPRQKKLREELVKATASSGLKILKIIRFRQFRVVRGDDNGRPFPLIAPEDARWMYEAFHRYDVAVLALRATFVRRDPSMDPARERNLFSLERFVRYKAYYGLIRSYHDIASHIEQFAKYRETIGCDGVDDPRALPLHTFYCDTDWSGLASKEGQDLFAREHGSGNRRVDCSGLTWQKPKGQAARHGGPALRVARRMLEQGFHWDVTGGPARTVYTPNAVWVLNKKGSYINIYPNGYVRAPGPRYGTVRKWPNSQTS